MKQYSAFSALWRAPLFLKSFYVDAGTQWRGVGILYLLMLELLTWLIVMIPATISMTNFINNDLATELKDFPPITLKAGVASSPVEQPYIMKNSRGVPVFVFDTTGKVKSPSDVGAMFLLTETEYIQDDGRGAVRRNPLKAFPDGLYDQTWAASWVRLARNVLIPAGVPGMTLVAGIYRFVCALIFACIGLAFNSGFGGKLQFPALLRLAVISMTGPVLINTVMILCHWNLGCVEFFLFHAITLGYMTYAVKVCSDATRPVSGFPVELTTEIPPPADGGQPTIFP